MANRIFLQARAIILLPLLLLLLGACGDAGNSEGGLPTSAVRVLRPLATIGPTPLALAAEATDDIDTVAQAFTPIPSRTPSPTPYIGVFLGQAEIDPLERSSTADAPAVTIPTRSVADFADLLNCPANIAPSPVFGLAWTTQNNLDEQMGCAIQQMFGFTGEVQIFENGVMYHNPNSGEVWAISPGTLGEEGAFWYVALAPIVQESPQGATTGQSVPLGAIGGAWASVPALRQALGFAVTEPQAIDVNIQRFDGGTLFLDVTVGQVFVLAVNGDAFGPF